MLEPGTDHCRVAGLKQEDGLATQGHPGVHPGVHTCDPYCLYDVEADPGESKDLANDPAHAADVQVRVRVPG